MTEPEIKVVIDPALDMPPADPSEFSDAKYEATANPEYVKSASGEVYDADAATTTPPGVPPSPANDVPDEFEIQLMAAEYSILLPQLLNACQGTNARVSIAAAMSAAACICVDTCKDAAAARAFLVVCLNDVLEKLPAAFNDKAARTAAGGTNAAIG